MKKTKLQVTPQNSFSYSPYLNKSSISVYNNSISLTSMNRNRTLYYQPNDFHRGVIQEFSRKARFRMLMLLSKIHLQSYQSTIFVTLTYHKIFPKDLKNLKNQLNKFLIYLKRNYKNSDFVWRLELQKRGAPHYHLFIFSKTLIEKKDIPQIQTTIKKIWFKCINDKNKWMDSYSVRIDLIDNHQKVFAYISKYAGKTNESKQTPSLGRRWGYSKTLILKEVDMIEITEDLLKIFTQNILNWLETKSPVEDKFKDYILNSQHVHILVPRKDFYIIFEKSIEQYYKSAEVRNKYKSLVALEFDADKMDKPTCQITIPDDLI